MINLFRTKLFKSFFVIIAIFTIGVYLLQSYREKTFRAATICSSLSVYGDIVATLYRTDPTNRQLLQNIISDNQEIRITVIASYGEVLYDNKDYRGLLLDNHISREEIVKARQGGNGWSIRYSKTFDKEYFYYAENYGSFFVRVAIPNDSQVRALMQTDRRFLYFIFLLFIFSLIALIFVSNNYDSTINSLRKQIVGVLNRNREIKREMTSNIAHELRTPVSSIKGYIETIIETPSLSQQKRDYFLMRANLQVDRLSKIISDISFITKIEETSGSFDKEILDISNCVKDVISDLKPSIDEASIQVFNSIATGCLLRGNRTLVCAIFRNLIENSVKYSGGNCALHIFTVSETNSHIYIKYYDTGVGISDRYLDKIFDRFYRIGKGRSRSDGGSGLGLAIVKNSVRIHHGTIRARNRKEGGLEFLFSLSKKD